MSLSIRAENNYGWQILDELIIAGELQESSKKSVLRVVSWLSAWRCGADLPSGHTV